MQPKHASIRWQDGKPFSESFCDIYFSQHDGMAETQHVFIDGNRLTERFAKASSTNFIIAETGFGTGSNLLTTLTLLSKLHPVQPSQLHFISTELYPLSRKDLQKSLELLPELKHFSDQLISQYPPVVKGMHRFIFDHGQFYLTLCIGDAATSFRQIDTSIDAWFLDGFAPSQNPEMWSTELFREIGRLSCADKPSTLATFTSAGFVRRGLSDAGFEMRKAKGFGKKREMLTGTFSTPPPTPNYSVQPWFNLPKNQKPNTAIVIGAGLAGCATAEALARRGIKVSLLEKNNDICQEASGNRQGALYAKLPVQPTLSGEFHLCGLEYSLRLLEMYQCLDGSIAEQCGLLQLATQPKEVERQKATVESGFYDAETVRLLSAEDASNIAGSLIKHPALWFPRAGWAYPKGVCDALIQSPFIDLKTHCHIIEIKHLPSGEWQVTDSKGSIYQASTLVVASASEAASFQPLQHLPLKNIRGQVSIAPVPNSTPTLKTVVCGDGYISPSKEGLYSFGATFDLRDPETGIRPSDHTKNLATLSAALPDLANQLTTPDTWQGKVGFRCTTPDYLPIAGPAPQADAYLQRYAKLKDDKNWKFENMEPPLHSNLYINTGHGSKGLITAPLASEYLASLISGEPLPISRNIVNALHPARFLVKDLIRGR